MAQPTPYNRLKDFLQYQAEHPTAPFNGADLDAEFDAIDTTLDSILTNLALIQRDDGYLRNGSVHVDSFSTASLALIASTWTPRGLWATTTLYAVGNVVQEGTNSYVCPIEHTSGTFATDYAAGKWVILGSTATLLASGLTANAYGHIAATTVQGFLNELVDEKARLEGSASQTFSVADATDDSHAANAGQIQKQSLTHAVAAGTADALTATLVSGLTTLSDGMRVCIEATAANATTAPTFNLTLGSTATGDKTIKKGHAQALLIGDISGAGHKLDLVYDLTNDCWLLMNPAFPVGQSTSAISASSVNNVGLAFAVGGSALTISLKTASGGTPSSSDSVTAALRSSSASTGTYNTRTVTGALSLTISSGSTLGHSSAMPAPIHYYLIDNAGSLELAASTKFHGYSGIVSTVAEGGAGGADSATVMYSTAARSNVPFVWIGMSVGTQATAGTWASTPTTVMLARNPTEQLSGASGVTEVPLPRGYMAGCKLANNGTDATNDIDIAVGVCRDSTNAANINVAAMTKRLDADWSAGTGNGMRYSGAAIANTTYHLWAVSKGDGTQDVYATPNASAATPSGALALLQAESGGSSYIYARRLGSIVRVSNAIKAFLQTGDRFMWDAPVQDVSAALTSANRTLRTLTVPAGLKVLSIITAGFASTAGNNLLMYITDPDQSDSTAAIAVYNYDAGSTGDFKGGYFECFTNTSSQIGTRSNSTTSHQINTLGYIDARGRDD